jgi:hypothetical protein
MCRFGLRGSSAPFWRIATPTGTATEGPNKISENTALGTVLPFLCPNAGRVAHQSLHPDSWHLLTAISNQRLRAGPFSAISMQCSKCKGAPSVTLVRGLFALGCSHYPQISS